MCTVSLGEGLCPERGLQCCPGSSAARQDLGSHVIPENWPVLLPGRELQQNNCKKGANTEKAVASHSILNYSRLREGLRHIAFNIREIFSLAMEDG